MSKSAKVVLSRCDTNRLSEHSPSGTPNGTRGACFLNDLTEIEPRSYSGGIFKQRGARCECRAYWRRGAGKLAAEFDHNAPP